MGRRLTLASHLSPEELEHRYKSAKSGIERGHYQLIWLLQLGKSTAEVAEVTGYSRAWIYLALRLCPPSQWTDLLVAPTSGQYRPV